MGGETRNGVTIAPYEESGAKVVTRIAIASDHAGFQMKEVIKKHLQQAGFAVMDCGTFSEEPVDYPDFVRLAAHSVAQGRSDAGIVIGGSGNGEAMAANKVRSIRCAVCWNRESARLAKEHNNANMVALGAWMVTPAEAIDIVTTWLQAEFKGERHQARIEKIEGTAELQFCSIEEREEDRP